MNTSLNRSISQQKSAKLNMNCKLHKSEIGGVCDNIDCKSPQQLLCVKCATDSSLCVRQSKHSLINLDEFIDSYFNFHLSSIKSNISYTQFLNDVDFYLNGTDTVAKEFKVKYSELENVIKDNFKKYKECISCIEEKFISQLTSSYEHDLYEYTKSIETIKEATSYDLLGNFDIKKCKDYLNFMPADSLNTSVITLKRTFENIKQKSFEPELKRIREINRISIISIKQQVLEELESLTDTITIFSNKILSKMVKLSRDTDVEEISLEPESQPTKLKSIEALQPFKEFLIDYSDTSNFLDKKFTAFEHSNHEYILCYPTSINTIKLESLDTILNDQSCNKPEVILNSGKKVNKLYEGDNMYKFLTFQPKASDRDKYLRLKLAGHGGKVTEIVYFQVGKNNMVNRAKEQEKVQGNNTFNSSHIGQVMDPRRGNETSKLNNYSVDDIKDLLITASEDKTIKIWNITSLADLSQTQLGKLNLNNKQTYSSPLLKTIVQQHPISTIDVFFNPLQDVTSNLELVTLGYGDKVKVYDLKTANPKREISNGKSSYSYDNVMLVFNFNDTNYLITANHQTQLRLWNYETSALLASISYQDYKVISVIPILDNYRQVTENFLVVDDKGGNSIFNIRTKLLAKLQCEFNSSSLYSVRNCAVSWGTTSVLFGYKNGSVREYSYNNLKEYACIEAFNTLGTTGSIGVTWIQGIFHSTHGLLLIAHYQNQKLLIFK